MTDKLTERQKKFVREYAIDGNGTKAAIRAGYSEKAAGMISSRLLKKPEIAAAIEEKNKAADAQAGLDACYVRQQWKKVVESCTQEVEAVTAMGKPIKGRDGKKTFRMMDALTARNVLSDIAKHLSMFDKSEEDTKEDGNTGVMKVSGLKSPGEWDSGS